MNYIVWGIGGLIGIYILDKLLSNKSTSAAAPILQPVPTYVATGSSGNADSASISNSPSVSSAVDSSTVNNLSAQDKAILGLNNLTSNLLINNQIQSGVNSQLAAGLATLQSTQTQQTNLTQLGIGSSSLLQSGLTAPTGSDSASTTFTPNSSGGFSTVVNYATSNLQSLYDSALTSIAGLTSTNQNLSTQVNNDNSALAQNAQQINSLNSTISAGTQQISNLTSTISAGTQQINALNDSIANSQQTISNLQSSLNDSNGNIVGLQGKVDALKNLGATAAHAAATISPWLGNTIQNQFNSIN